MTKKMVLITLSGLLVLFFITWFVWPTRYQYTEMKVSSNVYPVRIDRFTGTTEMLLPTGWKKLESERGATVKTSSPLPASELAKLEGPARLSGHSFIADMYNGTSWVITSIDINLTVKDKNGSTRFSRRYRIWLTKPNNRCEPLSSSSFSCDLAEYFSSYYNPVDFEWSVLQANGFKE